MQLGENGSKGGVGGSPYILRTEEETIHCPEAEGVANVLGDLSAQWTSPSPFGTRLPRLNYALLRCALFSSSSSSSLRRVPLTVPKEGRQSEEKEPSAEEATAGAGNQ